MTKQKRIRILGSMSDGATRPDHGPSGINTTALKRMRSIAGQVAGIEKMISDERYCVDIVDQISAVRAALGRVSEMILRRHIETCVVGDLASGDPDRAHRVVEELGEIMTRRLK